MAEKESVMKSTSEMIKALLGWGLVLLFVFTRGGYAVAQTCVECPAGLISRWSGDGNANDIIGSNHGTLKGGATFAPGKVGQAFSLDGVNDYIHVAESPTLDIVDKITIEAWIYPNLFSGLPDYVISKYIAYNLQVHSGRVVFGLSGPNGKELYGDSILEIGKWSHIAGVYDGSAMKIYVNGVLDKTEGFAFPINNANWDFFIGAGCAPPICNSYNNLFNGLIDEVSIYNRALTAAEIRAIVTPGVPPTAEAGVNQSIHAGQTVQLDGNGSFDDTTPTQNLQYAWSFTSVPPGSTATLSYPTASKPSFVADLSGTYVVSLVVTDADGLSSIPDDVTISSLNAPPNAEAGPDQGSFVGNLVTLNGSASNDPDFDPITFSWTLISQPAGSTGTLSDADTAAPTFVPDLPGSYVAELIVSDPIVSSAPDQVTIAVITTADFAWQQTLEAINTVGLLPPSSVTTKGNQTAVGNFLMQVIAALQVGDVAEAKKKLQDAIGRTDGCALRGSPDPTGGGQINQDYIKTCTDQAPVYMLLKDALDAISGS